jgi:hypothetical protein
MASWQVLDSFTNYIDLGGAVADTGTYNDQIYGGELIWVLGNMGGSLYMGNSSGCDANFPFICGFNESWTLGLNSGETELLYSCCSNPNPPMALIYDNTTWQQGNSCTTNGAPQTPFNLPGL